MEWIYHVTIQIWINNQFNNWQLHQKFFHSSQTQYIEYATQRLNDIRIHFMHFPVGHMTAFSYPIIWDMTYKIYKLSWNCFFCAVNMQFMAVIFVDMISKTVFTLKGYNIAKMKWINLILQIFRFYS